jgi:energy-coupling factor transporter ATP-binding protein EcfA2
MIELEHLTYTYPDPKGPLRGPSQARDAAQKPTGSQRAVLNDVSLRIEEGEFVLVVGPSGAGKSTLLRCINGLVPHFYGGTIEGHIRVAGRDPVALEPRRMSETVGFVFQDPEAQAVVDVVEDELAFAMENHGLPLTTMRKRVEEVLDQVNIAHLRRRPLSTLSGGERQRVAIASVLTLQPQVLVLDEPTSQLDPQAAEEVLDTLVKLNHDLGLTIVLSEHRLERVAQYADQVLYIPGPGEQPRMGAPRVVLAEVPLVPPLVELGKRLGWSPLPLTIKEARKLKTESCEPRAARSEVLASDATFPLSRTIAQHPERERGDSQGTPHREASRPKERDASREPPIEVRKLWFSYNGHPALRGVDLTVRQGEFVALMGRNGAGKTTLLKQCMGLLKPDEGQVQVMGLDTKQASVEELVRQIGYVPQNPNALLFADTIADELAFTRRAHALPAADDTALLQTLGLDGMRERYPRDLSAGERQRVALAAVLVSDPALILLDEPTRGLDYAQKASLIGFLEEQKRFGKTILVVTHDVELVAQCAERVVLMGDGEIIVEGSAREVMSGSQVFASQVNKLFRDPRYLTVQDVVEQCCPDESRGTRPRGEELGPGCSDTDQETMA